MTGVDADHPSNVWIVHREPRQRSSLARLAAAGENTLLAGPGDRLFESAPAPDVVVLGLTDDFERELEFAHRMSKRLPSCEWILIADPRDSDEATRLFEALPSEVLRDPPRAVDLQRAIRSKLSHRSAQPLSQRRRRDRLSERFAQWFGDFEVPGLLRSLDPRLAALPVLVRGESGTGRGLIARYVHAFSGEPERPFVHVACEGARGERDLLDQLVDAGPGAVVWLEEVDALPLALQRHARDWIDFGLPGRAAHLEPVRWMASAEEDIDAAPGRSLDPQLAQLLAVIPIHTPTLRERPDAAVAFAEDAARRWSSTSGLAARHFSAEALEVLHAHPWPGNLRELEAVVIRTLSSTRADPILPLHLRFDISGEWGRREHFATATRELASDQPSAHEIAKIESSDGVAMSPAEPSFDPEALALEQLDASKQSTPSHAPLETPREAPKVVDVASLLDALLDELRDRIQSRRLLVLKELDRSEPFVLGDPESLREAFSGLLAHALATVPDRGDMYLASSHHPTGLGGRPGVRVLLRFRKPDAESPAAGFDPSAPPATSGREAFARAEAIIGRLGGAFTGDAADPRETVIVVDLPAPGPTPPS